ncbi:MAG: hypothetical protein ACXVNF_13890 [Neobacillus sp.]
MSHSLDSNYLDNGANYTSRYSEFSSRKAYSSSYDDFRSKASKAWDIAEQTAKAEYKDLDDWEIIDCASGFDNANTEKMKEQANRMGKKILAGGTMLAGAAQNVQAGAFALTHGLGCWGYAAMQTSIATGSTWSGAMLGWCPASIQQYACANVAATTASAVTTASVSIPWVGTVSAASLATAGTTLVVGIAAIKFAQIAYNFTVENEEQKISFSPKEISRAVAAKIAF